MSEAGWYRNEQGRMQYWDGRQWVVPEKRRRAWPWVLGAVLAAWLAVAGIAVVVVLQERPWERSPQKDVGGWGQEASTPGPLLLPGEFVYLVDYIPKSDAEADALVVAESFWRGYVAADCAAVERLIVFEQYYGLDCIALQKNVAQLWAGVSEVRFTVVDGVLGADGTRFTLHVEEIYVLFGYEDGPYESATAFELLNGRWYFDDFLE